MFCCDVFEFVFCVSFRGADSGSDVNFDNQYSAQDIHLYKLGTSPVVKAV